MFLIFVYSNYEDIMEVEGLLDLPIIVIDESLQSSRQKAVRNSGQEPKMKPLITCSKFFQIICTLFAPVYS
jgi:hypothetical protein